MCWASPWQPNACQITAPAVSENSTGVRTGSRLKHISLRMEQAGLFRDVLPLQIHRTTQVCGAIARRSQWSRRQSTKMYIIFGPETEAQKKKKISSNEEQKERSWICQNGARKGFFFRFLFRSMASASQTYGIWSLHLELTLARCVAHSQQRTASLDFEQQLSSAAWILELRLRAWLSIGSKTLNAIGNSGHEWCCRINTKSCRRLLNIFIFYSCYDT